MKSRKKTVKVERVTNADVYRNEFAKTVKDLSTTELQHRLTITARDGSRAQDQIDTSQGLIRIARADLSAALLERDVLTAMLEGRR